MAEAGTSAGSVVHVGMDGGFSVGPPPIGVKDRFKAPLSGADLFSTLTFVRSATACTNWG